MKTKKASALLVTFIVCLVLLILVVGTLSLVVRYNLDVNRRSDLLENKVYNVIKGEIW